MLHHCNIMTTLLLDHRKIYRGIYHKVLGIWKCQDLIHNPVFILSHLEVQLATTNTIHIINTLLSPSTEVETS